MSSAAPALSSLKTLATTQLRELSATPAHRKALSPLASAFDEMRLSWRKGPARRALRSAFASMQVGS